MNGRRKVRRRRVQGWGCALVLGLGALGVVSTGAFAEEGEQPSRLETEGARAVDSAAFADALSLLNQKQLVLATLALERTQNPEVLRLARTLLGNHERQMLQVESWADQQAADLAALQMELQELGAQGSGAEGTAVSEKIESHAQRKLSALMASAEDIAADVERISGLFGHAFDQAFLEQVKADQKEGLALLERGSKELAPNEGLEGLVGASRPVLEQQLASAERVKKRLKGRDVSR